MTERYPREEAEEEAARITAKLSRLSNPTNKNYELSDQLVTLENNILVGIERALTLREVGEAFRKATDHASAIRQVYEVLLNKINRGELEEFKNTESVLEKSGEKVMIVVAKKIVERFELLRKLHIEVRTAYDTSVERRFEREFNIEESASVIAELEGLEPSDLTVGLIEKDKRGNITNLIFLLDDAKSFDIFGRSATYNFRYPTIDVKNGDMYPHPNEPTIMRILNDTEADSMDEKRSLEGKTSEDLDEELERFYDEHSQIDEIAVFTGNGWEKSSY